MSYAIICDARQGWKLGISELALVDRKKTRKLWWTSDSSYLIFKFRLKSAAEYSLKRLKRNNARIVSYDCAVNIIDNQENEIMDKEATTDMELGWDAHKYD